MKNWACTNDVLVLLMVVVLYPPYIIENISDYYTIDCFSTIFWLKKKIKKFLIFLHLNQNLTVTYVTNYVICHIIFYCMSQNHTDNKTRIIITHIVDAYRSFSLVTATILSILQSNGLILIGSIPVMVPWTGSGSTGKS